MRFFLVRSTLGFAPAKCSHIDGKSKKTRRFRMHLVLDEREPDM